MLLDVFLFIKRLKDAFQIWVSIYLKVRRMSELPVAMRAGEPSLVGVGHEVVVEAVLPGEGRPAEATLEGPQSRVTPELHGVSYNVSGQPPGHTCSGSAACYRR